MLGKMDEDILFEALYRTFRIPLSRIHTLKDFYSIYDYIDISNLKVDDIEVTKEIIGHALDLKELDLNSILETDYSNEELIRWLNIFHKHLEFMIICYKKGLKKICASDV